VNIELRDYVDGLVRQCGLQYRSDGIRVIIREHMAIFSKRNARNPALTPLDVAVNDNLITEEKNE